MDRSSIIAIAICTLLLLLWYATNLPRLQEMQEQPQQTTSDTDPQPEDGPRSAPAAEREQEDYAPTAPSQAADPRPPSESPALSTTPNPSVERPELLEGPETVVLRDADRMTVRIDPARGGISRITLLDYRKMVKDGHVELGRGIVPYLSLLYGKRLLRGDSVRVVETSDTHATAQRTFSNPSVVLTETWRLVPDRPYLIGYRASIENTGDTEIRLDRFSVACGSLVAEETPGVGKAGTAGVVELAVAAKPPEKKRPRSYNTKKIARLETDEIGELRNAPVSWVAVHNKYFLLHCEPASGMFRGFSMGIGKTEAEENADDPLFAVAALPRKSLSPGTTHEVAFQGYAGPKKLRLLKGMDNGLKKLMRLDLFLFFHPNWMEYVTSGILWALVELNDFFGGEWSYGYAIMVITFVIKMLFWPLTHTSTISMHRMQALQPQLKEIKEKHKDEPQKIQQKTMELYREHKVNPLGGCLPILLQIPIFFALFNTFRSAIELRQASFFWVQDLSLPDTLPFTPFGFPIRPLAMFMAATMLLQQMTTPTSGDPQQKKMMMFMTAFFVMIFYTMPAGLTLYWSVNQVLTIVQNIISRRLHKTLQPASPK